MVDCVVCAFQTSPHSLYGTLSPFFLTNTVRIFNQSINELRQLAKSPIYIYINISTTENKFYFVGCFMCIFLISLMHVSDPLYSHHTKSRRDSHTHIKNSQHTYTTHGTRIQENICTVHHNSKTYYKFFVYIFFLSIYIFIPRHIVLGRRHAAAPSSLNRA